MLPLRGAGLGAPPGADMAIDTDTDGWEIQTMTQRCGRMKVVLEGVVKERERARREIRVSTKLLSTVDCGAELALK